MSNLFQGATTPTSTVIPFIKGHTRNHQDYLDAIKESIITICLGPAGTGKTYMAAGMAAIMLLEGKCKKIVLTRPVIECGERIGFLPGDKDEKMHPYLLPLLDVLEEFLGKENVAMLRTKGIIEICPLAHMRGRTFKNAVIIADELQNATGTQIKMLITRLGLKSKLVLNGDITQSDIPGFDRYNSPLNKIADRLLDNDKVDVIEMDKHDIMRNPFLIEIIDILDKEF